MKHISRRRLSEPKFKIKTQWSVVSGQHSSNTYIWPRNTYKNTYIWHRNTYKNTYKKCLLASLARKPISDDVDLGTMVQANHLKLLDLIGHLDILNMTMARIVVLGLFAAL